MSANGYLTASELCPIHGGQLAKDAAAAWNAMRVYILDQTGYALAGPGGPDSSYRPYARQVYYRDYWCGQGNCANAAVPGTSNHGLGLAVDVPSTYEQSLINRYGATFGWQKAWSDAPSEPWHFKYTPGHYDGPDPGPEGKPAKPDWWKKVAQALRRARHQRLAKKLKRKQTDNPERKAKLHKQIDRLGDRIKRLISRRKGAK